MRAGAWSQSSCRPTWFMCRVINTREKEHSELGGAQRQSALECARLWVHPQTHKTKQHTAPYGAVMPRALQMMRQRCGGRDEARGEQLATPSLGKSHSCPGNRECGVGGGQRSPLDMFIGENMTAECCPHLPPSPEQGSHIFSLKGQIVNLLGSVTMPFFDNCSTASVA